jgi:hypothetical protein
VAPETVEVEDRAFESDISEALGEEPVLDDGAPGSETRSVDDGLATYGPPEAGTLAERSLEYLLSDTYENDKTVQDIIAAKERGGARSTKAASSHFNSRN